MPPLFTIDQGGPDIPDGVYSVILTGIAGPKTVTAKRGPKAGQEIDLYDWDFAIDEGPKENEVIQSSTSSASGTRSKMYAYITALMGGVAPAIGTSFEIDDLVGRRALATIRKDEQGWPRIENLGALPASMRGPRAAAQQFEEVRQPASGLPF
ncbi:MAG: hypothetical protein ACRDGQ_01735 [Candidatus Limnocylindrales bacterium]